MKRVQSIYRTLNSYMSYYVSIIPYRQSFVNSYTKLNSAFGQSLKAFVAMLSTLSDILISFNSLQFAKASDNTFFIFSGKKSSCNLHFLKASVPISAMLLKSKCFREKQFAKQSVGTLLQSQSHVTCLRAVQSAKATAFISFTFGGKYSSCNPLPSNAHLPIFLTFEKSNCINEEQ